MLSEAEQNFRLLREQFKRNENSGVPEHTDDKTQTSEMHAMALRETITTDAR